MPFLSEHLLASLPHTSRSKDEPEGTKYATLSSKCTAQLVPRNPATKSQQAIKTPIECSSRRFVPSPPPAELYRCSPEAV
eukprot:3818587-Rhodomonas_salina.1